MLAQIKAWLDAEQELAMPRSPMATAITYAQNQWDAITPTPRAAFSPLTTTPASERFGRMNWLFAGNDQAVENHARLWSLIANCERHGVDPQRYLTSVLERTLRC